MTEKQMDQQQQPEQTAPAPTDEAKAPPPQPQPRPPPQPKPAASVQHTNWPIAIRPPKQPTETKSVPPAKKKKHCNCKNSQCLKLYCECFAAGDYCDGCHCKQCGNHAENESVRQEAINSTKQRNPTAFQPKIENCSNTPNPRKDDAGGSASLRKHNKGCHCKKSGCLKKYCECFQANILCSKDCRCVDCKNFKGNEELQAITQAGNSSERNNIQHAANVALNGAIGSSGYRYSPVRRKRPPEDPLFQKLNGEGNMMQPQFQEANHVDSSEITSSIDLEGCYSNYQSRSKMVYRSPLAETIGPEDATGLTTHLVILCRKATGALLTTENNMGMDVERGTHTNSDGAINMDQQNEGDFGSCSNTLEDPRPASPGTQALMCDEQGSTFGTDYRSSFPVAFHDQDTSELNALQEKAVLTGFRDYLRAVITRGKINEANWSSEAAMELDTRRHNGSATILSPLKAVEKTEVPNGPENPKASPSASNCGSKDQE